MSTAAVAQGRPPGQPQHRPHWGAQAARACWANDLCSAPASLGGPRPSSQCTVSSCAPPPGSFKVGFLGLNRFLHQHSSMVMQRMLWRAPGGAHMCRLDCFGHGQRELVLTLLACVSRVPHAAAHLGPPERCARQAHVLVPALEAGVGAREHARTSARAQAVQSRPGAAMTGPIPYTLGRGGAPAAGR